MSALLLEQPIMHATLWLDPFHQAMTTLPISGLEMVSAKEGMTVGGREAPEVP
jgi:hypothetical protein